MVRIVVSGALGRMGKRIVELGEHDRDFQVAGKLEALAHPEAGIVTSLDDVTEPFDCIIEFTTPQVTVGHIKKAEKKKKAMVIGTTGMNEGELAAVREASRSIPIVFSPNMSVGVNLFFSLIQKSAELLGSGYKVSIKETHHVQKKDKPSGTAKLMADIVRKRMKLNDVPIESIREGQVVGDHDIVFESDVDTLTISHRAKTRDIFVLGALKAAKFVVTKKRGFFSMSDVLGLKD